MPDFCPLMDRKFSELAQHLGAFPKRAKDIRLISLSFDPEHDTPEVLRKHAAIRGAIAALVDLRGRLARGAGEDRGPDWGCSSGPTARRSPTTSARRHRPRGKLARLEVGTRPNRWETADFLKTIYALLPAPRSDAVNRRTAEPPTAAARCNAHLRISLWHEIRARPGASARIGLDRTNVTNQSRDEFCRLPLTVDGISLRCR